MICGSSSFAVADVDSRSKFKSPTSESRKSTSAPCRAALRCNCTISREQLSLSRLHRVQGMVLLHFRLLLVHSKDTSYSRGPMNWPTARESHFYSPRHARGWRCETRRDCVGTVDIDLYLPNNDKSPGNKKLEVLLEIREAQKRMIRPRRSGAVGCPTRTEHARTC